jgi:GTP-binding protein
MFADTAKIEIRAGNGGNGRMSFRHEKYREKGGPDGGNGGRGGDIVFVADHNQNTLSKYRTQRLLVAEDGEMGGENEKNGRHGKEITVPVPPGTQVWEGDTLIVDLLDEGQQAVIAKGGRGGFGNAHFTSSVRQAPRMAELGEPGEARNLRLELKMVADVGLIGLPNAGKSTLLSVISNAKPEIANYPFTTLIPNLGVVEQDDFAFLAADIPGLIEGASLGKGLGDEFLRHVERTAVLLHLIDCQTDDLMGNYEVIRHELASYVVDLSDRPQLVVLSKAEALLPEQVDEQAELLRAQGHEVFIISAQAHQGLVPLLRRTVQLVKVAREAQALAAAEHELPVIDMSALPDAWRLEQEEINIWRLHGERLEGFARRTDMDSDDGVERLRDILRRSGVDRALKKVASDDPENEVFLRIGDHEIEWR